MKNLFSRMAFLAVPALVAMSLIVNTLRNPMEIIAALAALIIAVFISAVFIAGRALRKVEINSFDEGMHIVMESVPTPCSLFDKDSNLMYCNEEALKLYGFQDREEYYKAYLSTIPEFLPDGRRALDVSVEFIDSVIKNGKGVIDWCQKTKNGELVPVKAISVRAFYMGEDHTVEFHEDKRVALEIERNREAAVNERMHTIMDSVPLLCAVYDEDGNVLEVNGEAEELFAIPNKQNFATNYNAFLPPRQPDGSDSIQKSIEMMKLTLKKERMRYEWLYKRMDGTLIPTEEFMTHITLDGQDRIIAFSRDLREQYAAKEAEKIAQKRVNEMMKRLNQQLETQASSITESSAAIEEMIANIRSVSNTLSRNAQSVKELQGASGVGHAGLNEVAVDIKEIAQESESLLGINSVMQDIASQTNLLSMNAAIEAAHAGASGRGFAVVADEIRKLAESSSKQSKTISAVLKKIKGSIDKITKSTENVMTKFEAINSGIQTVADQEDSILNAMTEQGAGSSQIMQAIAQVNEITHQVKSDARQIAEAAAKLGV